MNFLSKLFFVLALFFIAGLFSQCGSKEDGSPYVTVLLRLTHKVNELPLEFNQKKFTNSFGQTYSISKLNYIISNVKLRNKATGDFYFETNSYHLVKAQQNPANSEIILLNVPKKKFSQLEFSVGVDNGKNHSDDPVGDLNSANGMAWGWEIGYKFLEIEGDYTSAANSGSYVFHIGQDPTYKTYTFDFKNVTGGVFDIVKPGQILLDVNLSSVFGNPNPVDFTVMTDVQSIAAGADKIADNYATSLFKLTGAQ